MSDKLRLSEEFMLRFSELRNATNDSPQTLLNFFREKQDIREKVSQLVTVVRLIDWIGTKKKVHPQSSRAFLEAFEEYQERWSKVASYVEDEPFLAINLSGEPDFRPPTFEEYAKSPPTTFEREAPDAAYDDSFDPLIHDGGAAIGNLIDHLSDHSANRRSWEHADEIDIRIANTIDLGLGALEHLERDIGIDMAMVFERWSRLPPFFVPKHVSDKHGLTEKGSLYELLNDAIRAYVAGAPAAAIAMCRACLEMVIRENYLDLPENDRTSFREVIRSAAKRYEYVDANKLHKLREAANLALHKPRQAGRIGAAEEKMLLRFFFELRHYIQMAPEKGAQQ